MDWKKLQSLIKGAVIPSTAPEFSGIKSAMVWNEIKPDRSPAVIVIVNDADDVGAAICFARENNLKIAVHGGGHTWCGLAVRNGGMTIDLSRLSESDIDQITQKAIIQPAITNRELANRLGKYDLAFPIGHCPTVKAGGYLLNGGMSWNLSHWGPAALSVEAIEFVTADGNKVIASENKHADLFWAGKGCGPGMFAVATRFHLKCYTLPRAIMTSNYFYSLDDLKDVVTEVVRLGLKMPDIVELSIFLIQAPPELADQYKANNGKLCMITAVAFATTEKEGKEALAVLERGSIVNKCLSKTIYSKSSFEQLADASGATWPEHHRNLCENQCSKANPVDIVMALKDHFIKAPSTKSVIVFCQSTGGHPLIQSREDMALSMDAQSYGGIWTIWEKASNDAINKKWHNEAMAILRPFTSAHYIGETDIVEFPQHIQESYTPEKWQRLEQIRAKYDPDKLFFGFSGGIK